MTASDEMRDRFAWSVENETDLGKLRRGALLLYDDAEKARRDAEEAERRARAAEHDLALVRETIAAVAAAKVASPSPIVNNSSPCGDCCGTGLIESNGRAQRGANGAWIEVAPVCDHQIKRTRAIAGPCDRCGVEIRLYEDGWRTADRWNEPPITRDAVLEEAAKALEARWPPRGLAGHERQGSGIDGGDAALVVRALKRPGALGH